MPGSDSFRARLKHEAHRRLYDYWRSKAPPGRLPGRQHVEPLEIPELLPWLGLVDVLRDDGKVGFRYRLVGTGIVAKAGRDTTGKTFEQVYSGEYLKRALATYRGIVAQAEPYTSARTFPGPKSFVTYDRLVLPLARDGKTVDMLMQLMVFTETVSREVGEAVGLTEEGA